MRKNGINRELRPIEGGVCAPEGYKANAVACGIRKNGGLDFGMIFSEKRCSVACVYASGRTQGAPVKISARNVKNDYARAILVNGGSANIFGEKGERLALDVCDLLFPYRVERSETVIASTGEVGKPLKLSYFGNNVEELWKGLSASDEQSRKVAQSIQEGEREGQLSFSFDLGDYPCKIGAVFKGNAQKSPSTATLLAFLTTDVNISSPMLRKALNAEFRETLQLLNIDGVSSPNDTVCIFANGRAGNYRIDCADAEYKKFAYALKATLTEICKAIVKEGGEKAFYCQVKGAISKEVARASAKAIVGSSAVKSSLLRGEIDLTAVIFTLLSASSALEEDRIEICLKLNDKKIALYEEGIALPTVTLNKKELARATEIELSVDLREGNFQALAFGRLNENFFDEKS